MESGLEGRNNTPEFRDETLPPTSVSMESGLEGRNNVVAIHVHASEPSFCLNGVRPRRPEQLKTPVTVFFMPSSQWSPA